jgi:hypothetical protein
MPRATQLTPPLDNEIGSSRGSAADWYGARKVTSMIRAAAIAAVVSAALTASPAAQPSAAVALGLVRADGILVPFAMFDGYAWIAAWPEPDGPVASGRSLAAVPSLWRQRQQQVPQSWHVLTPGAAMREVRVLSHVAFDEHCGHQVGLLTDLQPRRADSHEKMLAADRAAPLTLPLDLSASTDRTGWQDLVPLIEAEAARQEVSTIADWERRSNRTARVEPVAQRKPVQIRRLYAVREAGGRVAYFEAERQYARSLWDALDSDPSWLLVNGWVYHAAGSEPSMLVTQAVLTDSDFKGAVRMKPVGIVRADGSTLWVGQEHDYESEAVSVLRVDATGVHQVFTRFIGGC